MTWEPIEKKKWTKLNSKKELFHEQNSGLHQAASWLNTWTNRLPLQRESQPTLALLDQERVGDRLSSKRCSCSKSLYSLLETRSRNSYFHCSYQVCCIGRKVGLQHRLRPITQDFNIIPSPSIALWAAGTTRGSQNTSCVCSPMKDILKQVCSYSYNSWSFWMIPTSSSYTDPPATKTVRWGTGDCC